MAIAPALLADCFPARSAAASSGFQHGDSGRCGARLHRRRADGPSLRLARGVLRRRRAGAVARDSRCCGCRTRRAARRMPTARPHRPRRARRAPLAVYSGPHCAARPTCWSSSATPPTRSPSAGWPFWMPNFLERVHGIPAVQATDELRRHRRRHRLSRDLRRRLAGDYWLKILAPGVPVDVRRGHNARGSAVRLFALTAASPRSTIPAIVVAELLLFMSTGPINSAIVNSVSPLRARLRHRAQHVRDPSARGRAVADTDRLPVRSGGSLGNAVLIVPAAMRSAAWCGCWRPA